jgi:hypothetical protein
MAGSRSSSKNSKRSATSQACSTPSASLHSMGTKQSKVRKVTPTSHGVESDMSSAAVDETPVKSEYGVSPPQEVLFVDNTVEKRTMGTKTTVGSLVASRLFPHIKFLCDPNVELMYNRKPKSICGVIMSECSPPVHTSNEEWWENARKWIIRDVSVLRNSKTTQLKWSFMSKY